MVITKCVDEIRSFGVKIFETNFKLVLVGKLYSIKKDVYLYTSSCPSYIIVLNPGYDFLFRVRKRTANLIGVFLRL